MTIYPNLEKLNAELAAAAKALGLPEFRSHVDASGRNLVWLKKVVLSDSCCSEKLKTLLNMPQAELMRAVQDREDPTPGADFTIKSLDLHTPQIDGIVVTEGFE